MNRNQRNHKGQVEINDLIDVAVNNAVFRRKGIIDSEDALSDEQAGNIAGGSIVEKIIYFGGYLLGQIN
ncbi:hypothetical protein [Chlorogloea sp. CCALA 695]|uniref:hypothetical protein n=1 Tax=Chlorogloea sp. CCALA 695 TaxID=2107693 RepID=UPI0011B1F0F5|nr:hypothetical protein [Chlorogloea sp. CCALA 695]